MCPTAALPLHAEPQPTPDADLPPGRRAAVRLAAIFAAVLFLFHLGANLWQAHTGWGYFRDEFYYLICGRHLAWGYVDHGPLVAVQARLAETIFGRSLAGIRMLSALAGAGRLFLTGLLAWSLGGRRAAQAIAMLGVALAPQYLGTDGYLSMNSAESLFWMTCLLALILILRGATPRLWLVFGAAAGLGLLNKPSMTFFLVALLLALLLTPARRLLWTPWAAAGVGLLLALALPNLLWQVRNDWPTLEFLRNGQLEHKNKALAAVPFLVTELLNLNPASLLLWGSGLVWLVRSTRWRWLGLTYLLFLTIMFTLHAKDYYVSPVYPILFAAGGVALEAWRVRSRRVQRGDLFPFRTLTAVLAVTGLVLLPMSTPLLSPASWITYARAIHLYDLSSNTETEGSGLLPQFFADRFGWQEEVDQVRRIYASLTPAEQQQVVIQGDNYGEASALNFLAPELPTAISGQNNYFLWGPGTRPGAILITIETNTPEHFLKYYDDVRVGGSLDTQWAMPFERRKRIFVLRGAHQPIQVLWPGKKDYI